MSREEFFSILTAVEKEYNEFEFIDTRTVMKILLWHVDATEDEAELHLYRVTHEGLSPEEWEAKEAAEAEERRKKFYENAFMANPN